VKDGTPDKRFRLQGWVIPEARWCCHPCKWATSILLTTEGERRWHNLKGKKQDTKKGEPELNGAIRQRGQTTWGRSHAHHRPRWERTKSQEWSRGLLGSVFIDMRKSEAPKWQSKKPGDKAYTQKCKKKSYFVREGFREP